jgi:hypothetical protein
MRATWNLLRSLLAIAVRIVTGAATLQTNRIHLYTGSAQTLTLPLLAKVGEIILIVNDGSGAVTIGQNAGQLISHAAGNTTTGVAGTLTAGTARDCIMLICTQANTKFKTVFALGTWTAA